MLEAAGFSFRVDTVKISEIIEENVNLAHAISGVAQSKVEAYLNEHNYLKSKNILLLSADTEVCVDNRTLGKPKNKSEAQAFLRLLSGRKHEVITGIFIFNCQSGEFFRGHVTTWVEFYSLSPDQIEKYLESDEFLDKAGGYGIQARGGVFVKEIFGSYFNVVGLPVEFLINTLEAKGWSVEQRKI